MSGELRYYDKDGNEIGCEPRTWSKEWFEKYGLPHTWERTENGSQEQVLTDREPSGNS